VDVLVVLMYLAKILSLHSKVIVVYIKLTSSPNEAGKRANPLQPENSIACKTGTLCRLTVQNLVFVFIS
jgi:hypothetical protein